MEQLILYMSVVGLLVLLGTTWSLLKRKVDLQNEDMELIKRILETVDYITKQFEFKYKDDISLIVGYTIEALDFVNQFDGIDDSEIKFILVKDKAISICDREGIDLSDGTVIEIIDKIVELILIKNK